MQEAYMEDLMKEIRRRFPLAEDAEITIECNPGTLTKNKLLLYHLFAGTAGIGRYPDTVGRLPRLLFSESSGMDFKYSVSLLWATPTPLISPFFAI